MSVLLRGSQRDVLNGLFRFFADELHHDDVEFLAKVRAAVQEIRGGAWLVNVDGFVFEVVDPPMTIEQDVYGCLKGRACTNVPKELRPGLDALLESRSAAGHGTDDRHFHWFRRIDGRFFDPAEVRSFVTETLGSVLVADAAVVLADNAAKHSPYSQIDLHVTLLPDRMRVRVDNDGSRKPDHPAPGLLPPGPDGTRPGGLAFIEERAQRWGVVGDPSWSVWADFARRVGDASYLALSYRTVLAGEILPGSYVYREAEHLAWVPIGAVKTSGGRVHLESLDGYSMPSFAVDDLVPVFADRTR